MAAVGRRLKETRVRVGMTQDEVVEALAQHVPPELVVKRPTLSNWEAGRNLPCMLQFRALCAIYGVTGYRIQTGANLLDLAPEEVSELGQLLETASPGLRRRLDVFQMMVRAAGTDRANA